MKKRVSFKAAIISVILVLMLAATFGGVGYMFGLSYVKEEDEELDIEEFSCDIVYEQARKCINTDHFNR